MSEHNVASSERHATDHWATVCVRLHVPQPLDDQDDGRDRFFVGYFRNYGLHAREDAVEQVLQQAITDGSVDWRLSEFAPIDRPQLHDNIRRQITELRSGAEGIWYTSGRMLFEADQPLEPLQAQMRRAGRVPAWRAHPLAFWSLMLCALAPATALTAAAGIALDVSLPRPHPAIAILGTVLFTALFLTGMLLGTVTWLAVARYIVPDRVAQRLLVDPGVPLASPLCAWMYRMAFAGTRPSEKGGRR